MLEEGKGVELWRQCGRDCMYSRWGGCADQGGVKRWSNVVEPCGAEPGVTKGTLSSVFPFNSPSLPLEILKK